MEILLFADAASAFERRAELCAVGQHPPLHAEVARLQFED